MSILRQAVRQSRCLQEPVVSRIAALAQSQLTCSAASAEQQRFFTGSSLCHSPVHIEDEPYCRQRQLIVLGNRVPELAPDSWVAPNAVVIGDVDIFDKVRCFSERSYHCVEHLSARQWQELLSFNPHTLCPQILPTHTLLSGDIINRESGSCSTPSQHPRCVQVSIWYGAVLRGDLNAIRVNSYSNIQDKTIIHAARCAHTLCRRQQLPDAYLQSLPIHVIAATAMLNYGDHSMVAWLVASRRWATV